MKIRSSVSPSLVFLDLEAANADGAIALVSRRMAEVAGLDSDAVAQALLEREKLGSTSVGNGFAIPHCKLADLDEIVVGLARFATGVDFGDEHEPDPVRFFFVVLSPPDRPADHLQLLSQIARVLKDQELRSNLISLDAPDAVAAAIQKAAEAGGL
jgi:mannitol/fructose-specific phosphotransferase system IIA component (Ntr-type)